MSDKYRKLYEEEIIKDIMAYTAFCTKDLVADIPEITDEDIYEFIETNYKNIIKNTLETFQTDETGSKNRPGGNESDGQA
ncbi:MAG: hypothetical protein ACLFQK_10900 [Fibrobacterota bacterium]